MKKKMIARMAPAGIVTTHDTRILTTTRKSIASMPRAIPTPSTAPTNVCVVEIGMPVPDAMTMVVAAASSAAKPRRDYVTPIRGQADNDARATEHQYPARQGGLGADDAVLSNADDGRQRADRVGDIVRTMRKRHAAGGDHHEDPEDSLDGNEVLFLFRFRIRLDASNEEGSNQSDANGYGGRQDVAVTQADLQADMLEPLEDRDERDGEGREKHVHRNIAPRPTQRVVMGQNQLLHAEVNEERNEARGHGGYDPAHDDRANLAPLHRIHADTDRCKTDDCANDRMRGRNRPAIRRGDQQPYSCCE